MSSRPFHCLSSFLLSPFSQLFHDEWVITLSVPFPISLLLEHFSTRIHRSSYLRQQLSFYGFFISRSFFLFFSSFVLHQVHQLGRSAWRVHLSGEAQRRERKPLEIVFRPCRALLVLPQHSNRRTGKKWGCTCMRALSSFKSCQRASNFHIDLFSSSLFLSFHPFCSPSILFMIFL